MTTANKIFHYIAARDWRILFGIVVTLLWLAGGIWYVAQVGDPSSTFNFTQDSVGSYLEGIFAPLAFLWLVLGLFVQQKELANNTKALHKTSEQSAKQTHSIAATEMNARQGSFFQIAESVKSQLGGISGMLYASSLGPAGSGAMNKEQMDDAFARAGGGDSQIFARMFISANFTEDVDLADLLYGTDVRIRHTTNFIRTFERLLKLARNCDVEGIIEDSLLHSAFGILYQRMIELRPA